MDQQVKEEENVFPWSHPEVLTLHKQFDEEFSQTKSAEEGEKLFHRFFAPTGLLDSKIREWETKDVDFHDVLRIVFELYAFKCFVFTCFFFNDFPEEIVKEWWEQVGMRSWASEDAFSDPGVKKIKQMFDKESEQCQSMLDLEGLKAKYLSPMGVLAQEFKKLRVLDPKKQVAIGAELFSFKSYMDYTVFATEFSSKAAVWTVPEVRSLEYQFETDLKASKSEEDFLDIKNRYIGKKGLIPEQLKKMKAETSEEAVKQVEELTRLQKALEEFFSSHEKVEN